MTRAPPPPAERTIRLALAEKLVQAWALNRQQVRVPLSLNLARMMPEQRALVAAAMAASLAACGIAPEVASSRLEAALARIGGAAAQAAAMQAIQAPTDLVALLRRLEAEELGAHAYAGAVLVLDRQVAAQRLFLDWLAARFALPAATASGLARRYRG
jgi:uncharacterized membrane protein YebE (DUF533 family)